MIQINLLPGAGRRSRGGGIDSAELLESAREWAGDRFLVGSIGAVVVALGLIAFLFVHQRHFESQLGERQIRAVEDSSRYSAVLAAKAKAESARDSLVQQLAIIKSIDDTRYLWSHVLEEISTALPPYTWLTAITQTSVPPSAAAADTTTPKNAANQSKSDREKAKKARSDSLLAASKSVKFRIVGQTVDIQALTRFYKALEASPYIQNVQLTRSDLIVSEGREVTEFQLEAESQAPPAYMLKTVPITAPAG